MKIKVSDIKKYIIVILLGIIVGLIINFINYNLDNKEKDNFAKDVSGELEEQEGIRILALKDESIHNSQYTLNLDNDNNFYYKFKVINTSKDDYNFDMKFYLDYKEVNFETDSQEYGIYNFNIKGKSEVSIPVKINCKEIKDNKSILILSMKNTDKDKNTMPYINCRYNLTRDENYTIKLKGDLYEYDKQKENSNLYGIKLNYDISNDELIKNGDELEKRAGEKIKVPIAFQGVKADNCLIWVTINNRQVKLNNNSIFMNLKLEEGYSQIKYLEMEAPKNEGRYEIEAHIVFNPWIEQNKENLEKNLEMKNSNKVFLNVKD